MFSVPHKLWSELKLNETRTGSVHYLLSSLMPLVTQCIPNKNRTHILKPDMRVSVQIVEDKRLMQAILEDVAILNSKSTQDLAPMRGCLGIY